MSPVEPRRARMDAPAPPSARALRHAGLVRQNLLLTQALELVSAGELESAQRLLAQADAESEGVSLDQVFRMYQDELQSQAQQLRDSQQRAEQALGWFANLFRSLPVAAVMVDEQGLVVDANHRAVVELNLELATRKVPVLLRRLMASPQGELNLARALKRVAEGQDAELDRVALRTLDGQDRVADLRLSRLPPRAGESASALTLCLLNDCTAQAEAARARQAAADAERQRDLAQAASQAKSQLLSRLSHELRTPLNAVLGFSHLLLTTPEAVAPAQQRRVQLIQDAGRHLLDLVDDVLQLNRSGAGPQQLQLQVMTLSDVVEEVLSLQQPDIEQRQLQLQLHLAGDDRVRAWADPRRVREVLTNLVSNAIKYNRQGGHLGLRCGRVDNQVFVEVRDSGIGLTPEQRAHLFEPFNRLGAEFGDQAGHGLGLSIALSLAQAMGGDIRVQSEPGEGSRFTLALPAAPD
jgi:signal transduction histidine kinase